MSSNANNGGETQEDRPACVPGTCVGPLIVPEEAPFPKPCAPCGHPRVDRDTTAAVGRNRDNRHADTLNIIDELRQYQPLIENTELSSSLYAMYARLWNTDPQYRLPQVAWCMVDALHSCTDDDGDQDKIEILRQIVHIIDEDVLRRGVTGVHREERREVIEMVCEGATPWFPVPDHVDISGLDGAEITWDIPDRNERGYDPYRFP